MRESLHGSPQFICMRIRIIIVVVILGNLTGDRNGGGITMKKIRLPGSVLFFMVLMLLPVSEAHAKEVPADGNIPLTAEYFPDEWFLEKVARYDEDKDGILSKEEIASVTSLGCRRDLSDFSQVQYFTNLQDLTLEYEWDDGYDFYRYYGVWAGEVLDLRVFSNLEQANLHLDTSKAPAGSAEVQIQVSGLKHLRELTIRDRVSDEDKGGNGPNVMVAGVDLKDTPALEKVWISDVETVLFDDENRIKSLDIDHVKNIPFGQIAGFSGLESLRVRIASQDFTRLDLSKNRALTKLNVYSDSVKDIVFAGASALETVRIEGTQLTEADVSHNPALKEIQLECPRLERFLFDETGALETVQIESDALLDWEIPQNKTLKELRIKSGGLSGVDLSQCLRLESLSMECPRLNKVDFPVAGVLERIAIRSDVLNEIDVSKNEQLRWLTIRADRLRALDVSKNKKLENLTVESDLIRKLDLKTNKKLWSLAVVCSRLESLDISANKYLRWLTIEKTPLKLLDLSMQTSLEQPFIGNNKSLVELNLSKNTEIWNLAVKNTSVKSIDVSKLKRLDKLEITGNKKLTALDLSQNRLLQMVDVENNALKTLKLASKVKMYHLNCSKNQLAELAVSQLPDLKYLNCSENKLKKLDLSKNKWLFSADVRDNELKTLKIGPKQDMEELDCSKNKLTSLDLAGTPRLRNLICDKKLKVKNYKGSIRRVS